MKCLLSCNRQGEIGGIIPRILLIASFVGGFAHPVFPLPGMEKLWRSWPGPTEPTLSEKELNLTGVIGRSVSLPCKVSNLEDKTVSWIRGRDLTVLAVDTTTYTGDQRFSVKHDYDSEDWWLQLSDITRADEGLYDCQINTYPKLSTKIYLKVVPKEVKSFSPFPDEPISDISLTSSEVLTWRELSEDPTQTTETREASSPLRMILKIKGTHWVRLRAGESLNLVCEGTRTHDYHLTFYNYEKTRENVLRWTLDDVPVEDLFPEWKANVKETRTMAGIESEFRMNSVAAADSGKISCLGPQAAPATVNLEVDDERFPKQHYLGLSNTRSHSEGHVRQFSSYPVTSAVSGAAVKRSNSKFAIVCAAVLLLFTLTNIAVCFHYLRKV